MVSKQQYLADQLSLLLKDRGIKAPDLVYLADSISPEVICSVRSSKLLIKCNIMNLYRAPYFKAVIGNALLEFLHGKNSIQQRHNHLILVFLFQRISRKAEDDLREYAREYFPDLEWIILAEDGSGILRIKGHDERVSVPPFQSVINRESGENRAGLFSQNSQWLFKVLVMPGMDKRYWNGPQRKPESINELAEISGVPQPSVSAFVMKAEKEGFLKREHKGFVIQNHQELLDDWSYAIKNKAKRAIGIRFLYPGEPEDKFLSRLRLLCNNHISSRNYAPVAVGGHLGCHLLGIDRSNIRQARLYANLSADEILSALDLAIDPSPSPQLFLVPLSNNEAILRSAVNINGIPVCDILQCYFDVRSSYARGKEQADYIYERVLQPHFEGKR